MLLIFDLDDTLIDQFYNFTPKKLRMVHDFLLEKGVSSSYSRLLELNKGSVTGGDAVKALLKELNEDGFVDEAIGVLYGPCDFVPKLMVGCEETLNELKKNCSLAVVSRGIEAEQMRKLSFLPDVFSAVRITSDGKKSAIQSVMDELGFTAEETWMIGDREADLEPASELGLKTVHIRFGRGDRPIPATYEIYELKELLDLCKQ